MVGLPGTVVNAHIKKKKTFWDTVKSRTGVYVYNYTQPEGIMTIILTILSGWTRASCLTESAVLPMNKMNFLHKSVLGSISNGRVVFVVDFVAVP